MNPLRTRIGVALACLLVAPRGFAGESTRYRIEVLPVPPGCHSSSDLHGLDEQDRVAGGLSCDGVQTRRAVIWDNGDLMELGNFGGPESMPAQLGSRGKAVGYAETPELDAWWGHVFRPFLWDGEELHDLGTLGGRLGLAIGINRAGRIVGQCQPEAVDARIGRVPFRACVWENGGVRDLGDLGGPEAIAVDVNSQGWIVGESDTNVEPQPPYLPGIVRHAFLHDGRQMHDLGSLGGIFSSALAVNDRGEAVGASLTGESTPAGYPIWRAMAWRGEAAFELDSAGADLSYALDINNRGQIVGISRHLALGETRRVRALLWEDGVPRDLDLAVINAEGWRIESATAINESGTILASAYRDGQSRLVLLVPVPEHEALSPAPGAGR